MNSIITPKALFVLLCLVLTIHLFGQQPNGLGCLSPNGGVIINEIGNISESKEGDLAGKFIELLVVGEDPTLPVNLEGYVIDDNHSSSSSNGSTSGHIKLGSCFADVMPGNIIVLYDDQRSFPGINTADDGAPNHAGVYQIPFNSDCLVKVSACPSGQNLSYNCAPDPETKLRNCSIQLQWSYPLDPSIQHFQLYRSRRGSRLRPYRALPVAHFYPAAAPTGRQLLTFTDENALPGVRYVYKVMAVHLDGGYSKEGSGVTVVVE